MPDVATSIMAILSVGLKTRQVFTGYNVILTHTGVEGNRLHESLEMMSERRWTD